jgi:hypothetical protein
MVGWEWENYWFIYSIFGLLLLPWSFAFLTVDAVDVLAHTSSVDFIHVRTRAMHPALFPLCLADCATIAQCCTRDI